MRYTDVAIIGGGLAGSIIAAALGRARIDAVLIDPHARYPADFRCEKLSSAQLAILHRTGLADAAMRAGTHDREAWIARFGYLLQKRPSDQFGILYDTLVNTMRDEIPSGVELIASKVITVATSAERQAITLADGEQISARLIVLATGLNIGLRHMLGLERRVISECHSITVGFDMAPSERAAFDFPALTYYPERSSDRAAYLTLFPIGETMRANLMVYRGMDDPWLRQMRHQPEAALDALMPRLKRITGDFKINGPVKIRPADLYVTHGYRQHGVVLAGDAFATSCPAAGTGSDKVFTDAERLCNAHIPKWLMSEGMSADKIAAFYDDPVKVACDAASTAKAYQLRAMSTDNGLPWRAARWARFLTRAAQGKLQQAQHLLGLDARQADGGSEPQVRKAA
jgi:2-polyprenyl-6-methoxyphenol hydroxylase-like FAD-dependent oxidoreductase